MFDVFVSRVLYDSVLSGGLKMRAIGHVGSCPLFASQTPYKDIIIRITVVTTSSLDDLYLF